MIWNYRVMIRDGRYAVHSVYYADDGRVSDWSAEPMSLTGDSVGELREVSPLGRLRSWAA